jgi:hypothetical protein
VKPSEHPDFFRFSAPEGRSRESTIRLDAEGRFFHDHAIVEHAKLAEAMHRWIARHPDDGRFILTNGYDWTYFTVEDVPYFVRSIRKDDGDAVLVLSDGSEEPLDPASVRANERGELYLRVKASAKDGPFDAKMTRFAQTQLEPFLEDAGGGTVRVVTKRGTVSIPGA